MEKNGEWIDRAMWKICSIFLSQEQVKKEHFLPVPIFCLIHLNTITCFQKQIGIKFNIIILKSPDCLHFMYHRNRIPNERRSFFFKLNFQLVDLNSNLIQCLLNIYKCHHKGMCI